jgi:hypothetical protein
MTAPDKLKIQLNRMKMEGLHQLIAYLLAEWPAEDKLDSLLQLLVEKIRTRIISRLDKIVTREGYTLSLSREEALAFELWYSQVALPAETYRYEQTVADHVCCEIDLVYG